MEAQQTIASRLYEINQRLQNLSASSTAEINSLLQEAANLLKIAGNSSQERKICQDIVNEIMSQTIKKVGARDLPQLLESVFVFSREFAPNVDVYELDAIIAGLDERSLKYFRNNPKNATSLFAALSHGGLNANSHLPKSVENLRQILDGAIDAEIYSDKSLQPIAAAALHAKNIGIFDKEFGEKFLKKFNEYRDYLRREKIPFSLQDRIFYNQVFEIATYCKSMDIGLPKHFEGRFFVREFLGSNPETSPLQQEIYEKIKAQIAAIARTDEDKKLLEDLIAIELEGQYSNIRNFYKNGDIVIRNKITKQIIAIVEVDGKDHRVLINGQNCQIGKDFSRDSVIKANSKVQVFVNSEEYNAQPDLLAKLLAPAKEEAQKQLQEERERQEKLRQELELKRREKLQQDKESSNAKFAQALADLNSQIVEVVKQMSSTNVDEVEDLQQHNAALSARFADLQNRMVAIVKDSQNKFEANVGVKNEEDLQVVEQLEQGAGAAALDSDEDEASQEKDEASQESPVENSPSDASDQGSKAPSPGKKGKKKNERIEKKKQEFEECLFSKNGPDWFLSSLEGDETTLKAIREMKLTSQKYSGQTPFQAAIASGDEGLVSILFINSIIALPKNFKIAANHPLKQQLLQYRFPEGHPLQAQEPKAAKPAARPAMQAQESKRVKFQAKSSGSKASGAILATSGIVPASKADGASAAVHPMLRSQTLQQRWPNIGVQSMSAATATKLVESALPSRNIEKAIADKDLNKFVQSIEKVDISQKVFSFDRGDTRIEPIDLLTYVFFHATNSVEFDPRFVLELLKKISSDQNSKKYFQDQYEAGVLFSSVLGNFSNPIFHENICQLIKIVQEKFPDFNHKKMVLLGIEFLEEFEKDPQQSLPLFSFLLTTPLAIDENVLQFLRDDADILDFALKNRKDDLIAAYKTSIGQAEDRFEFNQFLIELLSNPKHHKLKTLKIFSHFLAENFQSLDDLMEGALGDVVKEEYSPPLIKGCDENFFGLFLLAIVEEDGDLIAAIVEYDAARGAQIIRSKMSRFECNSDDEPQEEVEDSMFGLALRLNCPEEAIAMLKAIARSGGDVEAQLKAPTQDSKDDKSPTFVNFFNSDNSAKKILALEIPQIKDFVEEYRKKLEKCYSDAQVQNLQHQDFEKKRVGKNFVLALNNRELCEKYLQYLHLLSNLGANPKNAQKLFQSVAVDFALEAASYGSDQVFEAAIEEVGDSSYFCDDEDSMLPFLATNLLASCDRKTIDCALSKFPKVFSPQTWSEEEPCSATNIALPQNAELAIYVLKRALESKDLDDKSKNEVFRLFFILAAKAANKDLAAQILKIANLQLYDFVDSFNIDLRDVVVRSEMHETDALSNEFFDFFCEQYLEKIAEIEDAQNEYDEHFSEFFTKVSRSRYFCDRFVAIANSVFARHKKSPDNFMAVFKRNIAQNELCYALNYSIYEKVVFLLQRGADFSQMRSADSETGGNNILHSLFKDFLRFYESEEGASKVQQILFVIKFVVQKNPELLFEENDDEISPMYFLLNFAKENSMTKAKDFLIDFILQNLSAKSLLQQNKLLSRTIFHQLSKLNSRIGERFVSRALSLGVSIDAIMQSRDCDNISVIEKAFAAKNLRFATFVAQEAFEKDKGNNLNYFKLYLNCALKYCQDDQIKPAPENYLHQYFSQFSALSSEKIALLNSAFLAKNKEQCDAVAVDEDLEPPLFEIELFLKAVKEGKNKAINEIFSQLFCLKTKAGSLVIDTQSAWGTISAQGQDGKAAIHLIVENGNFVMLAVFKRMMESRGDKDLQALYNLKTRDGQKPLSLALLNGKYQLAEHLISQNATLEGDVFDVKAIEEKITGSNLSEDEKKKTLDLINTKLKPRPLTGRVVSEQLEQSLSELMNLAEGRRS